MKVKSQILPFLMIGIMLFIAARFAVFHSVIKIKKSQFRQSALLDQRKELKQLTFLSQDLFKNANNIEWKDKNKEIVIDGKFHEVISIEKNEGSYIVTIVEDSKENRLFDEFFAKSNKNDHLVDYIIIVLGMNFVSLEPFEFNKQCAIFINHQTHHSLNAGIELCFCAEKPPRI